LNLPASIVYLQAKQGLLSPSPVLGLELPLLLLLQHDLTPQQLQLQPHDHHPPQSHQRNV
jgi:hypothetical protein